MTKERAEAEAAGSSTEDSFPGLCKMLGASLRSSPELCYGVTLLHSGTLLSLTWVLYVDRLKSVIPQKYSFGDERRKSGQGA